MTTLESQGFLARTRTGRYRLGWQLLEELSRTLLDTSDFYSEALTVMREIVEHWGASTCLGVLNGSQLSRISANIGPGLQNHGIRLIPIDNLSISFCEEGA